MWRVDALEKTLMLGGIGGRRRRWRQRMRWLDGITDSMDTVWGNSGSWWWTGTRAAIHGVAKSQTRLSNWSELNWIFRCVYVQQLPYPFICWWTSRLLSCFSYVNSATVNTGVHVSFSILISSGYRPNSGIADRYDRFFPGYLLPYLILRRSTCLLGSLGSSTSVQEVLYRSCFTCRWILDVFVVDGKWSPHLFFFSSIILEVFCSYLFVCNVFVLFWYQGDHGPIKLIQKCSFLCDFWKSFRSIGANSSLKFGRIHLWSHVFLDFHSLGVLNYQFNLFCVIALFTFSIYFWFSLTGL